MKRRLTSLLALTLTLVLVLGMRPLSAQAAGLSFSGSRTLRSGESVTVVCAVSGSGLLAVEGQLSYDQDTLDLVAVESLLGSSWQMDQHGAQFLLRDNSLQNPISGLTPVFSVTFRVRGDAQPGSSVSAAVRNVMVSDGEDDITLGGDSWSADILRPFSGNNKLAHLGCDNGELSPAFDPGITDYRITVPFDVDHLSLSTEPDHSGSDVSVSGTGLEVGSNTVTITVTAENGSTRLYTITATREQDPNYVPNDDARLADLKPNHGRLSPEFDAKVREYVVYVPFETTSIRIKGTARDTRAQDVSGGSTTKLDVGDNLMKIKCTAEDGETFRVYQVHVWRMPLFAGTLPEIVPPREQIPLEEDEVPEEEAESAEKSPTAPLFELDNATTALVAVLMLLCCGVAGLFWYLGSCNERRKALPAALRTAVERGEALPVSTPVSCYEDENFPQTPLPEGADDDTPLADARMCSDFVKLERDHGAEEIPWETPEEALKALDDLCPPSTEDLPTAQEILDVLKDTALSEEQKDMAEQEPAEAQEAVETVAHVAEETAIPEKSAEDGLHIPEDLSDDAAVAALAEAMIHQILPNHTARPQDDLLHGMSVEDILRDIEDM